MFSYSSLFPPPICLFTHGNMLFEKECILIYTFVAYTAIPNLILYSFLQSLIILLATIF